MTNDQNKKEVIKDALSDMFGKRQDFDNTLDDSVESVFKALKKTEEGDASAVSGLFVCVYTSSIGDYVSPMDLPLNKKTKRALDDKLSEMLSKDLMPILALLATVPPEIAVALNPNASMAFQAASKFSDKSEVANKVKDTLSNGLLAVSGSICRDLTRSAIASILASYLSKFEKPLRNNAFDDLLSPIKESAMTAAEDLAQAQDVCNAMRDADAELGKLARKRGGEP